MIHVANKIKSSQAVDSNRIIYHKFYCDVLHCLCEYCRDSHSDVFYFAHADKL